RFFVGFRRARAEQMQPTVHICVFVLVVMPKRVDHRTWLLRGCRAIEINKRMAVCLFAQDREILAKGVPIHTAAGNFVHTLICSTRRRAPLYSRRQSVGASTDSCSSVRPLPPKCAPGRFRNLSNRANFLSIHRIISCACIFDFVIPWSFDICHSSLPHRLALFARSFYIAGMNVLACCQSWVRL